MPRVLKQTYIDFIFLQEERLINHPVLNPVSNGLLFHKKFNYKNFELPKVYGITGRELRYVGRDFNSYVKKMTVVQLKELKKTYQANKILI